MLLEKFEVDLTKIKSFGPRNEDSICIAFSGKVAEKGADYHVCDADILRMLVTRYFNLEQACSDFFKHLEWRQTMIPVPLLSDRTLKLLQSGIIYIHGRAKDGCPILHIEVAKIIAMVQTKEIDPGTFTSLHAFVTGYMIRNMLVPG